MDIVSLTLLLVRVLLLPGLIKVRIDPFLHGFLNQVVNGSILGVHEALYLHAACHCVI